MRIVLTAVLLLSAVWNARTATPPTPPPHAETVRFSGKPYARLGDWARANHFDVRWLRANEVVQLTNHDFRLVFTRDSREAELNGVHVSLSHPIVVQNGAGYIAEQDLETVIRPILSPPHNRPGGKIRNIVIDPGHGGRDPGNEDGSHQEKTYALLLARELATQLQSAGFNASLTRTTDTALDLLVRPDLARRRDADLFISLHWNSVATGRDQVRGIETYCLTPEGASSSNAGGEIRDAGVKPGNRFDAQNMFLAYQLQKSLVKNLGAEDRGVKRARFAVLWPAEMPAVLIEGGYMSHPSESKKIYDAAYRRQMAKAIVEGVVAYQHLVER